MTSPAIHRLTARLLREHAAEMRSEQASYEEFTRHDDLPPELRAAYADVLKELDGPGPSWPYTPDELEEQSNMHEGIADAYECTKAAPDFADRPLETSPVDDLASDEAREALAYARELSAQPFRMSKQDRRQITAGVLESMGHEVKRCGATMQCTSCGHESSCQRAFSCDTCEDRGWVCIDNHSSDMCPDCGEEDKP